MSAYAPEGYINNNRHDFGSILRFIEHNFGLGEGALKFSDQRAKTDLRAFFVINHSARPFKNIVAARSANFFLKDKRFSWTRTINNMCSRDNTPIRRGAFASPHLNA